MMLCLTSVFYISFNCKNVRGAKSNQIRMNEDETDTSAFPTAPSSTPTPNPKRSSSAIKERVSIPADREYYDTTNNRRGIALVFNHGKFKSQKERVGTEIDKNKIVQTLYDLKFDVTLFDDLTALGLRTVLGIVAGEDHSKNDCLIVVVMSHGQSGKIDAYDKDYSIEELWENFTGDNCPSLIGKPKLFFIQSCRGYRVDDGLTYSKNYNEDEMDAKTELGTSTEFFIPQLADLSIVFSTFDGYTSFRNTEKGTCFIQSVCEELSKSAETDSLQELILRITRRVAFEYQSPNQKKQIPTTLSTLTKRFYFPKNKTTCLPIAYSSLAF